MKIKCKYCGEEVYKVIAELYRGKPISSADFEGINGYESPNPGDKIECPACHQLDFMVITV